MSRTASLVEAPVRHDIPKEAKPSRPAASFQRPSCLDKGAEGGDGDEVVPTCVANLRQCVVLGAENDKTAAAADLGFKARA